VDSGRRTADVEGTHGQLGAGFADGLRRDHADRFAALHQPPGGQVASVARHADAALGFAGQYGADFDTLDTGCLNGRRQFFGDLLVDADDHVALIVALIFQHDAVAQSLDDFAGFDDGLHVDAFGGAAIVFADDHVLRHVHQAAREVARIGRLQRGVRQTLAGAVGGDEVLQDVEAFTEIGRDGGLDDLARRLGHQPAHTGKLADLLFRTARTRVGHDVNRVEVTAGAVVLFHRREHLIGNLFGNLAPDFDDLVVAFAVRDGAVLILIFHQHHFLLGGPHQRGLLARHHHVVDADGDPGARGVQEAQRLDLVQHVDGDMQPELEVAVLHQLRQPFLLQKAVDERHVLGQVVVEDDAADRGVHI